MWEMKDVGDGGYHVGLVQYLCCSLWLGTGESKLKYLNWKGLSSRLLAAINLLGGWRMRLVPELSCCRGVSMLGC